MNEIKLLFKENTVSAVICGIIGVVYLTPIAILFLIMNFLIEKPIRYMAKKIKIKKPKPRPKPKPKVKPRRKKY